MIAEAKNLRLVLVTPETTLVDEPVAALRFPLYDGMIGVLPGRAPAIGRLGFGELKVTSLAGGVTHYYVDGGFVQVKENTVTLLTNRAIPAEKINVAETRELLQATLDRKAANDAELAARFRDQERARQMLAVAASSGR